MLSDSYPSDTEIHSVIKVQNPSPCPSPGANLLVYDRTKSSSPWYSSVSPGSNDSDVNGLLQGGPSEGDINWTEILERNQIELLIYNPGIDVVEGVPYTVSVVHMVQYSAPGSMYYYIDDYGSFYMLQGYPDDSVVGVWQTYTGTFMATATENVNVRCIFEQGLFSDSRIPCFRCRSGVCLEKKQETKERKRL